MSRTLQQVQTSIIANIAANPDMVYTDENNVVRNITYNTSKLSLWYLWTWIMAAAIVVLEQLMDVYTTNIEAIVARSAAASTLWIQAKMFQFQYDATDPQVVPLIDTIPQYPVVNTSLCPIIACSVTSDYANNVTVKCATGSPLVALDAPVLAAAASYLNVIGDAGITYNVVSLSPDKIFIDADVFYNGMYTAVIKNNVIAALNDYFVTLSKINFNGSIKMSDLENVIRSVTGVNDVVLNNVKAHTDAQSLSQSLYLIQNKQVVNRLYSSVAGYLIQETDSGATFLDTLIFTAQ